METTTNKGVNIKIFIGFELSVGMKMELKQSPSWKQAQVSRSPLIEARYQEKDYIGAYLDFPMLTIKDLRNHSEKIKKNLSELCPGIDIDRLNVTTFPQVFVS